MSQEQWTAVDRYLTDLLVPPDAALETALRDSAAAGLPAIQVSPNQGKLLHILARALPPGGRLVTLEVNARHADIARANLSRAGLAGAVDVILGPALETLP